MDLIKKYEEIISSQKPNELYEIYNSYQRGLTHLYYIDEFYIIGSWYYQTFSINVIFKDGNILNIT